MIDGFLRGLRQPEYVHVLLNPPPSTHCHVDPHIRYLDFRMAGL